MHPNLIAIRLGSYSHKIRFLLRVPPVVLANTAGRKALYDRSHRLLCPTIPSEYPVAWTIVSCPPLYSVSPDKL